VIRDLLTNRMSMHEVPDTVPEPALQEVAPEARNQS
jgi:hypothetical protein